MLTEVRLHHWLYDEASEAAGKLILVSKPASLHLRLCVVVIKDFYSHPTRLASYIRTYQPAYCRAGSGAEGVGAAGGENKNKLKILQKFALTFGFLSSCHTDMAVLVEHVLNSDHFSWHPLCCLLTMQ